MRPQWPAVVVQRGYGDCKDKALLLTSMLRALGIDARPTLVSLATHDGPASMLPAPEVFDHVVVQVRLAGREYYLDPTRHGQAGLLSRMGQRLEGAAVLPVDADTQALAVVRSPNRAEIFRSQMHERMSLTQFGAEGRLDVEIQWFGINAENLRLSLLRMDATELRRFVAAGYLQQYAGSRLLGEPEVSDDRRLNQLTISASFAVPRLARASGEQWGIPFAPGLGDAIVLPSRPVAAVPAGGAVFPGHLPLPGRHDLARRRDARRGACVAAPGRRRTSGCCRRAAFAATAKAARSSSRPRSARCRPSRCRAWPKTWAGWHARSAA